MQPDAILVNTSRGPLVDAAALIEVLKRNALGGVACEEYERDSGVFYSERSEPGANGRRARETADLYQVIVASNMGGLTWEALGEIAATTLASLTEFEPGTNLPLLRLDGPESLPGEIWAKP
jgi:D-lactate dehydrogenase